MSRDMTVYNYEDVVMLAIACSFGDMMSVSRAWNLIRLIKILAQYMTFDNIMCENTREFFKTFRDTRIDCKSLRGRAKLETTL